MLRIHSTLPDDLEDLIHGTIGCCIAVHKALGPGLVELAYSRAVCHELELNHIPYEQEKAFQASYRGRVVALHRVDILVAGQLVLELKAVARIHPVHVAQLLSCLRISHCRAGLLVNFNVAVLPDGIRRFVL